MKNCYGVIFAMIFALFALSSALNFARVITPMEIPHGIIPLKDGNYLIHGVTPITGLVGRAPIFIKVNKYDSILWVKTVKRIGIDSIYFPACPTTDSGFVVVLTEIFSNLQELVVLKFNSDGVIQWITDISLPDTIIPEYSSIDQTSDGGYIISVSLIHLFSSYCGIIKLNSTGNLLWVKKLVTSGVFKFNKIIAEPGNKFTLAAHLISSSIILTQFSPSGLILRSRQYNLPWSYPFLRDFRRLADGGYILTGWFMDVSGRRIHIVKLDSTLNIEWSRKIGFSTYNFYGNQIIPTHDGGFAVAGITETVGDKHFLVLKLGTMGTIQWVGKIHDSHGIANGIIQKADSSIIAVGPTVRYAPTWVAMLFARFEKDGENCLAADSLIPDSTVTFNASPITIRIESLIVRTIPISLSDSEITYSDSTLCSTGSGRISENTIKIKNTHHIYPNPFNNACVIYAPNAATIEIFDISGKRIAQYRRPNVLWKPDEKLGSGVYIVRIRLRSGKILSYRAFFIK